MVTQWKQSRKLALALASVSIAIGAMPLAAQAQVDDARVRKIESEVRALQRQVFPGGDGRFFTPEVITPGDPASLQQGTPSTSAVTDILGRVGSIEAQLMRLTAQTEENNNAISVINDRLDALEFARTSQPVVGGGAADGGLIAPQAVPPARQSSGLIPVPGSSAPAPQPAAAPQPAPTPAGPSAARLAAVQEIAKPQSDDAGDDEYVYGFRLWDGGFYPEATQQLSSFVTAYPSHWRISYGRNLLGRALFDDNQPGKAAGWFIKNYEADNLGARAADSLLFLSESMIKMNDTRRACIALGKFHEQYPALGAGRLSAQYEATLSKVTCN